MLAELEDVKVQVYARDKSLELQQKQIEELLEELRESKGLENDVKLLVQKKRALKEENIKLREELNKNMIDGSDEAGRPANSKSEIEELVLINRQLNDHIKALTKKYTDESKNLKNEVDKLKKAAEGNHT